MRLIVILVYRLRIAAGNLLLDLAGVVAPLVFRNLRSARFN